MGFLARLQGRLTELAMALLIGGNSIDPPCRRNTLSSGIGKTGPKMIFFHLSNSESLLNKPFIEVLKNWWDKTVRYLNANSASRNSSFLDAFLGQVHWKNLVTFNFTFEIWSTYVFLA